MKSGLDSLLSGGGVFLLMLLFAEFVVRIMYKDDIVMFPRYAMAAHYDDYTIHRLRPNSEFYYHSIDSSRLFHINAQGFRNDRDFAYTKPPGTLRVAIIGDSHTQGYEVHQR